MKYSFLLGSLFFIVTASNSLCAGVTEAERYVDTQGIEVIHNRSATLVSGNSASSNVSKIGVSPQLKPVLTANNLAMVESKMQIPKQEQQKRDSGRLSILNQEMMMEASAYQTIWRALHVPNMKASLDIESTRKLQQSLNDHEQNIRLLTSEIINTKKSP